jgi:ubiquitin C-terminal hydrolase
MDLNKLTGFNNIGNTCYLNSALQLIIHCTVFSKFILSNNFTNKFLKGYKQTLIDYFTNNVVSLSPNIIKKYIGRRNNMFSGFSQQDSHELIVFLLDYLEECLKEEKDNNIKLINNTDHKKILSILFDCKISSIVKCNEKNCNDKSKTKGNERMLSLPIPVNLEKISLINCLEEFSKEEMLDGDNMWFSEKLDKKVNASKKLIVKTFPKYLLIHLKRFSFYGSSNKIDRQIDIPFELNLNNNKYNLRGFILHLGSVGGGHYMSFIKKEKWHCCNDSNVSSIDDDRIRNISKSGYIFLFVKDKNN